jgi:hypothetical protein
MVAVAAMVAGAMAAVTGISAGVVTGILAVAATRILAVDTTAEAGSPHPVHFHEAVFTAIALLPDAAGRTSAGCGMLRWERGTSATQ